MAAPDGHQHTAGTETTILSGYVWIAYLKKIEQRFNGM